MNEEDKIAWIDEENKIVSFHAIDDGKMIIKAESLFWDFLFGLTESGYYAFCVHHSWCDFLQIYRCSLPAGRTESRRK